MILLHGQQLVKELRQLSDSVSERLWVAVPYIGSPTSVRRILGKQWFERPSVNVKLLTDTSDLSCLNTETIQHFYNRGQVKTLPGLHAKIYIIDNTCLVTSANLTNTAFSKRHEIGILCNSIEAQEVIDTFIEWWEKSGNVNPLQLNKIFSKKHNSKEETGILFPTIYELPKDPGAFVRNLAKRFLNYDRLVDDYEDFARKYASIQRIWENEPIFLEIDGLFDYLYHQAPDKPSRSFATDTPRTLTDKKQLEEIKKWAKNYKEWNNYQKNGNDIGWRVNISRNLSKLLSPNKVMTLNQSEIEDVMNSLNSLNAYPINKRKILNNNSLAEIRAAFSNLVNGQEQLAMRMTNCNLIKNLGTSSMNEILGFTYPTRYPLINKNSNSGLRFFGYQIRAYN